MKTIDSAVTNLTIDKFGALHMYIEHDVVKAVTPKMLEWWFRNIGGEMEYQGKIYPKYLVWHPYDHIQWNLSNQLSGNAVGVGSKFHLVEAFGADTKMLIDVTQEVLKLDEAGITLSYKRLGIEMSNLSHKFIRVENGTKYISHLKIGTSSLFGKFFINPIIRRFIFNEQKGRAWIKHNIEEVGNFEVFLPALFEKEVCS
jgi:hypothetical protein